MERHTMIRLFLWLQALLSILFVSCERLDNDIQKHVGDKEPVYIELDDVAGILSSIPLEKSHLDEVYVAVSASSNNGYDEEYMIQDLFAMPGKGVGDDLTRSVNVEDGNALRDLIGEYVRNIADTKSGRWGIADAEEYLKALADSDIQIYWPFSENWDGQAMPIVTFDPEDGADVNIGYRLVMMDDGSRHVEEVMVDEEMACREPVWVVNRNSDAGFMTLEMLRRNDPDWGEGGGSIIVEPSSKTGSKTDRCLRLKSFTMLRNYDTWLAGASEFFIKIGYVDDFTASTEAELKLFNPLVTDLMIVVRRNQLGVDLDIDAILISDWNPQMTHCALLINEDDGGVWENWKCTALVRVDSRSYGVELSLPIHSFDDIVWRGQLSSRWLEANNNIEARFGDTILVFEVVEY